MATDIKNLKNRIRSIDSTLHLTKAMGLVAAAKVRGAMELLSKAQKYEKALVDMFENVSLTKECQKSVYMQDNNEGKTCLVVIAGDRGLAGGYNSNIFKLADSQENVDIIPLGMRACERYGAELVKVEKFDYLSAYDISKDICEKFEAGIYNKVSIVSTKYISMMHQDPGIEQILPLQKPKSNENKEFIFEPDSSSVIKMLVTKFVAAKIYKSIEEGFACELVARRLAMDSAGKNANQIMENLKLEFNRARQGAITQEITEIVAGSGN